MCYIDLCAASIYGKLEFVKRSGKLLGSIFF